MQKGTKAILAAMATAVALYAPTPVLALSLGVGTPLIAIDGDYDSNTTVWLLSLDAPDSYEYGYYLNGSRDFVGMDSSDVSRFQGGDVLDFALRYRGTGDVYSLSGDADNDSYSVTMWFGPEVTHGNAQQPAGWDDPYYKGVLIGWDLGGKDLLTAEIALNRDYWGNDGIAPYRTAARVPEPATLLLLGVGLLGLRLLRLKRAG